jgi:ABC-type enterochelin transport system substrate-binding protein
MHLVTRTVAALAAVLTALALVACGSDDGASGGSASTPSTAAETAFPVTVGHKFGSTTIPSAPKRVVAVATPTRTRCSPSASCRSVWGTSSAATVA